jgi:cytosine/adenosine deaminase-related metal-dependent hydrolase
LLLRLKNATRLAGLPFSLHLAESTEEMEFMATGKGAWLDFLKERGMDPAIIKPTRSSPVVYADRLGILDEKTLAVHLVFADKKDILLLRERNVSVCLCPRSNEILHHRLPDVEAMAGAGLKLCLGTDSLASNNSLSLFDEMRFLGRAFPGISPGQILYMATIGGATALGYENRFGRLAKGFAAKMIYIPMAASEPEKVLHCLANRDFTGNVTCID